MQDVAQLLEQALKEEKQTDAPLTLLAEQGLNQKARAAAPPCSRSGVVLYFTYNLRNLRGGV